MSVVVDRVVYLYDTVSIIVDEATEKLVILLFLIDIFCPLNVNNNSILLNTILIFMSHEA